MWANATLSSIKVVESEKGERVKISARVFEIEGSPASEFEFNEEEVKEFIPIFFELDASNIVKSEREGFVDSCLVRCIEKGDVEIVPYIKSSGQEAQPICITFDGFQQLLRGDTPFPLKLYRRNVYSPVNVQLHDVIKVEELNESDFSASTGINAKLIGASAE